MLRQDITKAIRKALFEELAATGYGRLSIEAVARRAGVGKTAVYRRWSSKLEMVIEMIAGAAGTSLDLPDTGSLQTDLELVLFAASRALQHPLASQIIPDLLAEAARSPEIGRTLQSVLRDNQRAVAAGVVARAIARGEITPDNENALVEDLAMDLIVGPMYWRVAVARTPLPDGYVQSLSASVSAALRAAFGPT